MRRLVAVLAAVATTFGLTASPAARASAPVKPVTAVRSSASPGSLTLQWSTPKGTGSRVVIVEGYRTAAGTPYYPPRPTGAGGTVDAKVPAGVHHWIDTNLYGMGADFYFSVFTTNAAGTVAARHSTVHVHLVPAARATTFVAYYVLPKGTAAHPRTPAVQHDLEQVLGWYRAQTHGRAPRFVRSNGKIVVRTLHLLVTAAQLRSRSTDSVGAVLKSLALAKAPASSLAVAFVEGRPATTECGIDGGPAAVLWMQNCGGIYPSVKDSAFPYGAGYLAAHEMTHALGAVRDCAPHATGDGHVDDSPNDILYEGRGTPDWDHIVLDYKHDDYYGNAGKCTGITNDAVWVG